MCLKVKIPIIVISANITANFDGAGIAFSVRLLAAANKEGGRGRFVFPVMQAPISVLRTTLIPHLSGENSITCSTYSRHPLTLQLYPERKTDGRVKGVLKALAYPRYILVFLALYKCFLIYNCII